MSGQSIFGKFDVDVPMPAGTAIPPRSSFQSRWAFGDRVHIDDDRDLQGRVIGFNFSCARSEEIHVAWMHNGVSYSAWFQDWRLTAAAARNG
jgi:hypothetical protein